jgi:eukaryotic-like serine/threonine-protein kinase
MVAEIANHYHVREKLGEGGMGEVFRARDTRLNRFVAIKALRGDQGASAEDRARLLREHRDRPRRGHGKRMRLHCDGTCGR